MRRWGPQAAPNPGRCLGVLGQAGFHTNGPWGQSQNRRRAPRVKCDHVRCSIGDVLDISSSGIRIVREGDLPLRAGQEFLFELTCPEGKILVLGKMIRGVKLKGGRFEYGLEWVKHDDRLQSAVRSIARGVVYNETMRPDIEKARKSEW